MTRFKRASSYGIFTPHTEQVQSGCKMGKLPTNESLTDLPHIVKFSGGRSSGMMLMELLSQNALQPKRGDVVVFNNTSAEHPETYKFTRKMKALTEEKYNIPFFWIEYQTYEDASRTGWRRNPSYRLVNESPYTDKNKNGYRYKGEVFEEMISLNGYLPNMLSRTCTLAMKISITNSFLEDWFAQKNGIDRLGHFWKTSRITDENLIRSHKANRGETPDAILLAKRKFVRKSAFIRKEAVWKDYTNCNISFNNNAIKDSVFGGKGELFGERAIRYVSYLGIRKDEEIRIEKIRARIEAVKNKNGKPNSKQPPQETVLAPLIDYNVTRQQVIDYWKKQDFDLNLLGNGLFSNCVYCPLKGRGKLLQIASAELANGNHYNDTPASIDWWITMENKYSRDLRAEKRAIKNDKCNYVGFFGSSDNKTVYAKIKEKAQQNRCNVSAHIAAEYLEEDDYMSCNCTD